MSKRAKKSLRAFVIVAAIAVVALLLALNCGDCSGARIAASSPEDIMNASGAGADSGLAVVPAGERGASGVSTDGARAAVAEDSSASQSAAHGGSGQPLSVSDDSDASVSSLAGGPGVLVAPTRDAGGDTVSVSSGPPSTGAIGLVDRLGEGAQPDPYRITLEDDNDGGISPLFGIHSSSANRLGHEVIHLAVQDAQMAPVPVWWRRGDGTGRFVAYDAGPSTPEPHALVLFAVGALTVAARLARRSRS